MPATRKDAQVVARAASRLDLRLGGLAASLEGRNGRGDDGGTGTRDWRGRKRRTSAHALLLAASQATLTLSGDEADALHVLVAVLVAVSQLGGELGADRFAEQQRDGTAACGETAQCQHGA